MGNGFILEVMPDHLGDFKLTNTTKIYPDEPEQQDLAHHCKNGIDVTKLAAEAARQKPKTVFYVFLTNSNRSSANYKKLDKANLNEIIKKIDPMTYTETQPLADKFADALYSRGTEGDPEINIVAVAPQTLGVVRKEDIEKILLSTEYLIDHPEPTLNSKYFILIPETVDSEYETLKWGHQQRITKLIAKPIDPQYFSNSLENLQTKAKDLLAKQTLSDENPDRWIIVEIVAKHRTPPNITINDVKQAFHLTDDPKPGIPNPLFNKQQILLVDDYENPLFWGIKVLLHNYFIVRYSPCVRLPSALNKLILDYQSNIQRFEKLYSSIIPEIFSRTKELGISTMPIYIAMQEVVNEIIELVLSRIHPDKKDIFKNLYHKKIEYNMLQYMNSRFRFSDFEQKNWIAPSPKERRGEAAITYTIWNYNLRKGKVLRPDDQKQLAKSIEKLRTQFGMKK